jgi:DNA-binding MarR family transcriptional regulator
MKKAELINEVISLFHRLGHSRMHYQFEHWRKLDVPLAQLKSLFIINFKENINVRDLALELGVTPGNVTSIVDRLVAQRLVRRCENPEDRRVVLLELTDQGRNTLTEIHETGIGHIRDALEKMNTADITALARGVGSFITAMEKSHEVLLKSQKNTAGAKGACARPQGHGIANTS